MKKLLILLLLSSSLIFAQSWKPEVTTTIGVALSLKNLEIFTNKFGNHVLANKMNQDATFSLEYNLLNSSGSVIRSFIIETAGYGMIEFPKISGSDDNLYVVYRSGGVIKTWKSTDVGVSWNPITAIQVSNNTCMGVEIAYNSYGLHVVWSNQDKGADYATYYYRYTNEGNLVDYKEVTDFTNGKGGRPTIALSDYKIHVSFDMGQYEPDMNGGYAYTRDKYFSNPNWESEQQATTIYVMATKVAVKDNQIFLFYYKMVSDMGDYHSDLYVKTRDVNGTVWSSPTLVNSVSNVMAIVKTKRTSNGNLNIIYDYAGVGVVLEIL